MRMKIQGRLMQARFIEIYQVFAKQKSDTFITEGYMTFLFVFTAFTVTGILLVRIQNKYSSVVFVTDDPDRWHQMAVSSPGE